MLGRRYWSVVVKLLNCSVCRVDSLSFFVQRGSDSTRPRLERNKDKEITSVTPEGGHGTATTKGWKTSDHVYVKMCASYHVSWWFLFQTVSSYKRNSRSLFSDNKLSSMFYFSILSSFIWPKCLIQLMFDQLTCGKGSYSIWWGMAISTSIINQRCP